MRAGALRKRFMIQSKSAMVDEYGGQASEWTDVGKVWGDLVPSGGKEEPIAGAIRDYSLFTVTIRFFAGLSPQHRLKLGDRIFNVLNVLNIEERNREMQLEVQEGLNNG